MSKSAPLSLAEMRAANGAEFSDADYLHYVTAYGSPGSDFFGALLRFLNPEFEWIDGKALVVSTGSPGKYRDYRAQGKSASDAQYWANLTEISGMFGEMEFLQARAFAFVVKQQWQAALSEKLQDQSQQACFVKDESEQEVFVTIQTMNDD